MNAPADTPGQDPTSRRTTDDPSGAPPSEPTRQRFEPEDPVDRAENWLLVRCIGQGGFGEVWLARHEWKNEFRAVKFCTHPVVRHRLIGYEKTVLLRVMRNAGEHPNIVPLLEYSLKADIPWLMYQYVEGGTLAEALAGWKLLPVAERLERTVRTLHAMTEALGHCHRLVPPIVHRDLKPHNVLMDGNVPRITDFGIGGVAVAPGLPESSGTLSENSVKMPTVLKTARSRIYAAPERAFGSPTHPRDDVYSLGVIAYQLVLADTTAVPGTDAGETLRELGTPDGLISLVVKSVAMDPNRRPKDAGEWAIQLAALRSIATPPVATPRPEPVSVPQQPAPPAEPSPQERAEADYQHAVAYDRGRGVEADPAQARAWYEKAAVQGHPGAQYALGMIFRLGRRVPQDYAAARMWFTRAAESGYADAQYALGLMCDLGQGLGQDLAQARRWYEKAAAQGHVEAQVGLGVLYESGRGVPQDPARARRWYESAATQGNDTAKKGLERLKKGRR